LNKSGQEIEIMGKSERDVYTVQQHRRALQQVMGKMEILFFMNPTNVIEYFYLPKINRAHPAISRCGKMKRRNLYPICSFITT
jgi:hypothetical protein